MIKTIAIAAAALTISSVASARPNPDFHPAPSIAPHVAGVPEPAAWALMLTGLFGVGFSLRRRSRIHA